MELIADVAVWAATALALVSLLPQLRRLWVRRIATGVSVSGPAIGVVTNAGWTAYLAAQGLWAALPSAAVMVVLYAVVVALLRRAGASIGHGVGVGAAWAVALAAVGVVGGWDVFGVVLGLAYVVQVTPTVWTAYRTWAPVGIAPATWAIVGVEVLLWAVYGWVRRDPALLVFATTGIVASAAMLLRAAMTRGRAPSDRPAATVAPLPSG